MEVRRQRTATGQACLLAAAALGLSAILFHHPLTGLAAGFALGLYLLGSPRSSAFERLRVVRLPPAHLIEDEERLLELEYALDGSWAPLGVVLRGAGPVAQLAGAAPSLAPTAAGRLPVRVRAQKRGRHERLALEVELRGALGFAARTAHYDVPTDLWVLPRPRALRDRVLEQMLALRPWGYERPQPTGPGDGDFYALRDWREGDAERRVHPRLTARRGRKVVRLFRGEAPPVVHLVVDLRSARDGRRFGRGDFDEAMRFAAGIVRTLLQRCVPVSLTLLDGGGARVACPASCKEFHVFLGELALARSQAVETAPDVPVLPTLLRQGRKVVLHLGQIDESRCPADWLAIRVGARRYYQLLDPQLAAAAVRDEADANGGGDGK